MQWKKIEDFYCKELQESVCNLTDEKFSKDIHDIIELNCKGQFSSTIFRKSYASKNFKYHASKVLQNIKYWIAIYFYETSVEEMLKTRKNPLIGFADFVALEINRNNQKVIDVIKEMILGDNNVLINTDAITGIIKSDNKELKELLKGLLIAAKGQEGLRQSILEKIDSGDLETFKDFFGCCVENDLFRFSSAARAFYTWTGVYPEEIDIKFSRHMSSVAYQCLTDEAKRKEYYQSANPFEIYLSIWAKGCEEIEDTSELIDSLLNSKQKYKKYIAWQFISKVENDAFKHAYAIKHLDTDDMCYLGMVTDCLYYNSKRNYFNSMMSENYKATISKSDILPEDLQERRKLFDKLASLVELIGNNQWNYPGYLFPWSNMRVSNDNANIIPCMLTLAGYDLDDYMIDRLHELLKYFSVIRRGGYYFHLLQPETNKKHKEYIIEGLKDKSLENKDICIHKLMNCEVEDNDIITICKMFSTKSGDLRKILMKYLDKLSTENKLKAVRYLVKGSENLIQTAIELLLNDGDLNKYKQEFEIVLKDKTLSDQTQLLYAQLFPEEKAADTEEITVENGYGLFDPNMILKTVEEFENNCELGMLSEIEMNNIFLSSEQQNALFKRFDDVFLAHKDYEYSYINYADEKITVLFGDGSTPAAPIYIPAEFGKDSELTQNDQITMDMIPFADEFREAFGEILNDKKAMIGLKIMVANGRFTYDNRSFLDWFQPFVDKHFIKIDNEVCKKYSRRMGRFNFLINIGFKEIVDDEVAKYILDYYLSLYRELGKENRNRICKEAKGYYNYYLEAQTSDIFSNLRSVLKSIKMSDEMFKVLFKSEYAIERAEEFEVGNIFDFKDYIRAIDLGIITQEHLCDWIICEGKKRPCNDMRILTTHNKGFGKEYCEKYEWFKPLSDKVVNNLVIFEAQRGQADTPVSKTVLPINRINGVNYFVLLLKALGSEGFYHGYQWSATTKQSVLSILLRKCYPKDGETVETLKALLKDTGITEKRLIEAAMYSPQWAPFIEEITGWKGLKKAVWFFHAHVSEEFSSDKETEVALYSPISPKQFNDGIFDADWFRESYAELGEKRISTLHKFAKYITTGTNSHKRSQLFADAASNKLIAEQLEVEITEKRNQERLRAYAIIPLKTNDISELLHRYEFISKYIKESKQFGAQRRESEGLAGSIALANLAVTCGISDVNRMLWKLERAKNEEIVPFLSKKEIDGYHVWLQFDAQGDATMCFEKGDKPIKSIPKPLAKNEYIEQIKQKIKELKDQKVRGRNSLENAMIKESKFDGDEIYDLLDSYTLAPMIQKLVWICGNITGFPEKLNDKLVLKNYDGQVQIIDIKDQLLIAHPHHLAQRGIWNNYMHYVYENSLVQPFKQVFREYYPITEEEKDENTVSRRYAGYQVQPTKTAGLLKSRGWTVDYDYGWQKVNYNDDTMVRLYAYADWFTAAEIESPTLEEIKFYNRKNEEPIKLTDINPVYFSEIMRDLDLVVSVAYVGGVDVETSHSTVEMRRAIAKELCSLMKLDNVEFLEKHAKIYGKLAEYSVHLGSGVVHATGKGAIVILPVHSQHRGHIFLPFADEDPKTAEIMSKIILLSDDSKIKDPTILSQLSD